MWIKIAVFMLGTLGLMYVSRASLMVPASHGFYRFFAWEAILALALVNLDFWFRDPFAWHQILSWTCLLLSLYLVLAGVQLLKKRGAQDSNRQESALLEFERTTTLVTEGIYRFIRHPLYSSLLFLAWGVFFKSPSWLAGLLAFSATLFLSATARVEEAENVRYFGEAYEEYMQRTRMFIPFLF